MLFFISERAWSVSNKSRNLRIYENSGSVWLFLSDVGGISEHVFNFVKYALAAGHDVKIITPTPWNISKKRIKHLDAASFGDRIIRFGRHLPVFSNASLSRVGIALNTGKKLKKLFADENSTSFIFIPRSRFYPMIANNCSDTLTVGTIHTYFKSNFWFNTLKKSILKYYDALDGCIAVSESCRELIEKMLDRTPWWFPTVSTSMFLGIQRKNPAILRWQDQCLFYREGWSKKRHRCSDTAF